jgi:hypothetical protein
MQCGKTVLLFDHIVGDGEQRRWHFEAERISGLEVDDQVVLGWRLHGQIGRLLALEDAINVAGRPSKWINRISAVGNQAAASDETAERVDRGQSVPGRQRDDQIAMSYRQQINRLHHVSVFWQNRGCNAGEQAAS